MDLTTDWFAVIIAALLNTAIGFVWYSKWSFGPIWIKLCSLKEKEVKKNRKGILWSFFISFIAAFFVDLLARHLGITTVSDGMFLGLCIWIGFDATTQIGPVIWCKKPFQLFAIDTGYKLLSFLVAGGVIGA